MIKYIANRLEIAVVAAKRLGNTICLKKLILPNNINAIRLSKEKSVVTKARTPVPTKKTTILVK